jgi:hypothetical protein
MARKTASENREKAVRNVQIAFLMFLLTEHLKSSKYCVGTWWDALVVATRAAEDAGLRPKSCSSQSGDYLVEGKVNVPWPPGVCLASEKNGKQAARALVKYL